jgi:hypothetical protein
MLLNRKEVEDEVDAMILGGQGKRTPKIWRPFLGDTHKFRLAPTDIYDWLSYKKPLIADSGNIRPGTVQVSHSGPSRLNRFYPPEAQNHGRIAVQIEATINDESPIGYFYHLYLPVRNEGYQIEHIARGPALPKFSNLDVTPHDLSMVLKLLKSSLPY